MYQTIKEHLHELNVANVFLGGDGTEAFIEIWLHKPYLSLAVYENGYIEVLQYGEDLKPRLLECGKWTCDSQSPVGDYL